MAFHLNNFVLCDSGKQVYLLHECQRTMKVALVVLGNYFCFEHQGGPMPPRLSEALRLQPTVRVDVHDPWVARSFGETIAKVSDA